MVWKQQKLTSHSCGGQRSEIRVPTWSGSSEPPVWAIDYHLLHLHLVGRMRALIPFERGPSSHMTQLPPKGPVF